MKNQETVSTPTIITVLLNAFAQVLNSASLIDNDNNFKVERLRRAVSKSSFDKIEFREAMKVINVALSNLTYNEDADVAAYDILGRLRKEVIARAIKKTFIQATNQGSFDHLEVSLNEDNLLNVTAGNMVYTATSVTPTEGGINIESTFNFSSVDSLIEQQMKELNPVEEIKDEVASEDYELAS